jgi:hypothetical protein
MSTVRLLGLRGFVGWAGAWALDIGGLIGVLEVSLGG